MKRIMLLGLVIFLGGVAVAWAKGDVYKLVMNEDKSLCSADLAIFNKDRQEHKNLKDQHEIFNSIPWKEVHLGGIPQPGILSYCTLLESARFDINNDGIGDLVLRKASCLRGFSTQQLYVFPADSEVLDHLSWENMQAIFMTEN